MNRKGWLGSDRVVEACSGDADDRDPMEADRSAAETSW